MARPTRPQSIDVPRAADSRAEIRDLPVSEAHPRYPIEFPGSGDRRRLSLAVPQNRAVQVSDDRRGRTEMGTGRLDSKSSDCPLPRYWLPPPTSDEFPRDGPVPQIQAAIPVDKESNRSPAAKGLRLVEWGRKNGYECPEFPPTLTDVTRPDTPRIRTRPLARCRPRTFDGNTSIEPDCKMLPGEAPTARTTDLSLQPPEPGRILR